MPMKLVRRGRVKGYRPTREQVEQLLELAQGGVGEKSAAHLEYSQGNQDIYPSGEPSMISPENLTEIINLADNPPALNNLDFSISCESPLRRVSVQIGPGDWTTYLVESDDQTWAHGRYHELTEKLLADRGFYAKGNAPSPQVLQKGSDNKWRDTAWELKTSFGMTMVNILVPMLWIILLFEIGTYGLYILAYNANKGNTKQDISNRQSAAGLVHWLQHNAFTIFGFNLSCIIALIALGHWFKSLRKSTVILREASLASQFNPFQKGQRDAVALASFYAIFFTLVVTVIAIIVG